MTKQEFEERLGKAVNDRDYATQTTKEAIKSTSKASKQLKPVEPTSVWLTTATETAILMERSISASTTGVITTTADGLRATHGMTSSEVRT